MINIDNTTILLLMTLFIIKHFIVDFLWQTPYQWQNKHIYGHPGGIIHALLHSMVSWSIVGTIFGVFNSSVIAVIIIEFIAHYTIDWGKMNFNIHYNINPDNPIFWQVLGVDQLLHYLTYIWMIYYII